MEEAAAEAFKTRAYPRMEGASRAYLAEILRESEKLDQAEAQAHAAVDLLEAAPPARVYALGVLARVLLAKGLTSLATATSKEAMAKLEALGGLEEGEAMVRLVYAEALDATGDRPGARQAVLAARDRLLARAKKIENTRWRESFLSGVPEHARTLKLSADWE
jgi:hypothetical protein